MWSCGNRRHPATVRLFNNGFSLQTERRIQVFPRTDEHLTSPRIASAAAAAVITVVLPILIGLGVSAPASAQPPLRAEPVPGRPAATSTASVERGRYLIAVTGCNDCHTPGYGESGGRIPESEWLMGAPVGFRGPWGVSYPANLRLTVQNMNETQWLTFARVQRLPPMPWFALRDMSDDDLRSLYRYIRTLGPKGTRAPAAVAPGREVTTPFILFVPQTASATSVSQVTPASRDDKS
jgi:mono/diheme cytochrome c family protein